MADRTVRYVRVRLVPLVLGAMAAGGVVVVLSSRATWYGFGGAVVCMMMGAGMGYLACLDMGGRR